MPAKPRKSKGRPRDPAIEERILDATLELLAKEGYERMSIDSVAATAGVTKPTIYRRFRCKAELATAALSRLQQSEPRPSPKSSAKAQLLFHLRNFQRSLLRPGGMRMIGTLLVEEERVPELLRLFRQRIVRNRRQSLRALLEAAKERGELAAGIDIDAAVNLAVGSFYARYLATGSVPKDWPERIVDTLWSGIAAESSKR